jgi:hypothetical protein
MMSSYVNAQPAREHVGVLSDGGELRVTLLHGIGPDAGRRCIHRVTTDMAGRLRSDIVYFYDSTVKESDVEADFFALARNGILSTSQLHHTESMLNRGRRFAR